MFERFERPIKIICVALAALLAWQVGGVIFGRDPLSNLKIPPLPTLPESTNEPAKSQTGPTSPTSPTNTPSKSKRPGSRRPGTPGMPGGLTGGGMKKMELPPDVQARVDRIIESEIFGPLPRPMPMALLGIADNLAFIQATNGQSEGVKVGGELGGIKLLKIGINRVLIETGGEKQELTLFDGIGSESLMPKMTNEPSTNAASTNTPSTNAPAKKASKRKAPANDASTNQTLSPKQKENP